jgi:hypothetical protein
MIVLSASALPADKTAAATLACIMHIFAGIKEKYDLFLQGCVESGVDISEFPSSDGITLKKMAHGCIGMSDNAPTALSTTALLVDRVRELVEKDFSAAQLDAMPPTERDALVRMLRVGCFPHLRCLLAKWAVEEEEKFLKPHMPEADQHMRMEPTVSSLLFAIQKNFRRGFEQYAKGEQHDFYAFYQRNYPGYVMFDTGRPGTGSRMDAAFEVAYAVAMNFELYLNYLVYASSIATEAAILSDSIKNRLGSVEFYAPLICRARF